MEESASEEKEKLTYTSPDLEDVNVGSKLEEKKKVSKKRKAPPAEPATEEDKLKNWAETNAPSLKRYKSSKKKSDDRKKLLGDKKSSNAPCKPKVDVRSLNNLKKAGYITKFCQVLKLFEFLGEGEIKIDKLATFNNGSTWKIRTEAALEHLAMFDKLAPEDNDGSPEAVQAAALKAQELELIKARYGKRWWTVSRGFAQKIKKMVRVKEVASQVEEDALKGKEAAAKAADEEEQSPEVASEEDKEEEPKAEAKKKAQTKWVLPDNCFCSLDGYVANEQLHPSSSAKPIYDDVSGRPFLFLTPLLELSCQ